MTVPLPIFYEIAPELRGQEHLRLYNLKQHVYMRWILATKLVRPELGLKSYPWS